MASNGDVYTGEFRGDVREGRGKIVYASGDVYDGSFKNNVREGRGIYTSANGNIYDGEWKNNVMEGHGTFKYASGDIYVGDFKNGIRNSHGVFTYASGDIYSGEFKDDLREGFGTYTFAGDNIRTGDWMSTDWDGSKADAESNAQQDEGQGKYSHTDPNDVYEEAPISADISCSDHSTGASEYGSISTDDVMEGQGEYTYTGGDQSTEEHKDMTESGGKFSFADYDTSQRKPTEEVIAGQGTFIRGDSDAGDFKSNVREGHGTYVTAPQDNSDEIDERHGTYSYAGNKTYIGEWKEDMREGRAICTYADGRVSDTEFEKDKCIKETFRE